MGRNRVLGAILIATSAALGVLAGAPRQTIAQVTTVATQLPPATHGKPYSQALATAGGPARRTWTIVGGSLPAGLSLSPAGLLSGTPSINGSFSFTVRVTGATSGRPIVTTHLYALRVEETPRAAAAPPPALRPPPVVARPGRVAAPPPAITTPSPLPPATQGKSVSDTLAATGGQPPYHWSIAAGNLPAGMTVSPAGVLSGTPGAAGNFSFTLALADSTPGAPLKTTKPFTLSVAGQRAASTKVVPVKTALTATGFPAGQAGAKIVAITTPLTALGYSIGPIVPKTIAISTEITATGFPATVTGSKTIPISTPLTATGF